MKDEIFHKVLQYMEKSNAQQAFDFMSGRYHDQQVFLVITYDDYKYGPIDFFGCPEHFALLIEPGTTWYYAPRPKDAAAAACYGRMLTNYPIFHTMKDGGTLCQACLSNHAKEVMEATDGNNPQWEYAGTDVNYEDTSLHCDHCEKRIPSAYRDDEEE